MLPHATSGTGADVDDDGFLENIFHLQSMEKFKNSHRLLKLTSSLPPSPADSGVSDVDSSSSGGQPACSDELKARLGASIQTNNNNNNGSSSSSSHPGSSSTNGSNVLLPGAGGGGGGGGGVGGGGLPSINASSSSPTSGSSLPSSVALSAAAAAAAATQQHLQQQAQAHLPPGTFLRPNFYHHSSPPLRNIWNQRSVP
ncbi:ecdysone-induced protein 74EF-like, partial [Topomyia yanbarensis]|uniref:ecdysone-induced protein 74EF-like n=1 Tax=Topomyia yanbarensis TaxID=2498891 RepID=UPI00273AAB9E